MKSRTNQEKVKILKKIKNAELNLKKSEGLRPSFFYMSKTENLNFFVKHLTFSWLVRIFTFSLNYATFWRFWRKFQVQIADIQQVKIKTLVFRECTLKRSNESAVLKYFIFKFCFFWTPAKSTSTRNFCIFNRILTMCLNCAL